MARIELSTPLARTEPDDPKAQLEYMPIRPPLAVICANSEAGRPQDHPPALLAAR